MKKKESLISRIFLGINKIHSKKAAGILTIAALLVGMSTAAQAADLGYMPGRLLIKTKPGVTAVQLSKQNKTMGITMAQPMDIGLGDWHIVSFNPKESVEKKAKEYLKSGLIVYAEPDYIQTIMATQKPNDPAFSDKDKTYSFRVTDTLEAWSEYTDASDIVVAVVDTGVNYLHEDLKDNMWVNPYEIPDNGIDDDANGIVDDVYGARYGTTEEDGQSIQKATNECMDVQGHGTHVSGTIGARGDNKIGTAGVCWKVKIMAVGTMNADGRGYTSDIISGLAYARNNGANVINMSLGGAGYSTAYLEEIKACARQGIIVVAAAGNEGSNNDTTPSYPASYSLQTDNIIAVGSSDANNRMSSFSNYGKKSVHIFAPGSDIYSTAYEVDWEGNPKTDAYQLMSGTSMACPFVAGTVALTMAAHPGEGYTKIINRILNSAKPYAAFKGKCTTNGRITVSDCVKTLVFEGFEYDIIDKEAIILGYVGTGTKATVPASINGYPVTTISAGAFAGSNIEELEIPGSVTTVLDKALEGAKKLKTINLQNGLISIGNRAFANCTALESINLPATVETLGSEWVLGCESLQAINVDPANQNYSSQNGFLLTKDADTLLVAPAGVSTVQIPGSVTSIGEYAFAYNTTITDLYLPESFLRIGQYAFQYCTNLKSVTCGKDFTSVGIYAFYGCTSLKSITFTGNAPAAQEQSFQNIAADAIIYRAQGSTGWEKHLDEETGLWNGVKLLYSGESDSDISAVPTIQYTVMGDLTLIEFSGTLESSTDGINWEPVSGATSPYAVPSNEVKIFYRSGR